MNTIKKLFNDINKYGEFIRFKTRCELKSDIIDTKLGWIWWILEPLCFMFIYMFVFMFLFKSKEESYALFIFVGVSIWDFFSGCLKKSVNLIKNNSSIIKNTYIPKTVLVIQTMAYMSFRLLICMSISALLMVYYKIEFSFKVIYVLIILLVLFFLTYSISCFLMHFGVYLSDLSNITNIVLRMIFYITGIFYSIPNRFPAPYNKWLIKFNPIALLINEARNILIYNKIENYHELFLWLIISIIFSVFSSLIIYKNENSYLKVN